MESTTHNRLNFLDTTLVIDRNTQHLKHFGKPTTTDCLTNFKTAASPKSYKIGAFEVNNVNFQPENHNLKA